MGAGRAALGQDEHGAVFHAGRAVALEKVFEQGNGAFRIGIHQAVDGHQLQFFVGLVGGGHGLAGALFDLDLERLRVIEPVALRKIAAQGGD